MNDPTPRPLGSALRTWLRTPPRLHGEVDSERTVSFLELFYDLVFVVLVAQIAHHLAAHPDVSGVIDFAVVFGLVWLAWMNGSLYHEVHGREDGRHRGYIFGQMYLLVVLAVFAGHATDKDGAAFAVTYALLMLLITYQWWVVYRLDTVEAYKRTSSRYIVGMLVINAAVVVSIFTTAEVRLWVWGGVTVVFVLGNVFMFNRVEAGPEGHGVQVTESMAERFGLFTIIVLGEVVVGVANGVIETGANAATITVALLAMTIGFGFWWNYFDVLGRQLPRNNPQPMMTWILLHLPLHGAIAAAGAGMVGLIEHAQDDHLSAGITWLLVGSTAALLIFVSLLVMTIDYPERANEHVRTFQIVLWIGVSFCVVLGFLGLPSWALALGLALALSATWAFAFFVRARSIGVSVS